MAPGCSRATSASARATWSTSWPEWVPGLPSAQAGSSLHPAVRCTFGWRGEAAHRLGGRFREVPRGDAEIVLLLARHGVPAPELAPRLAGISGLRNLLVHSAV